MARTRTLPMFPLGTVLFPYALLPLHVFEDRYRVMARRVLGGDREFGVVLIERGSEVGGGDARFGVGTVARVVRASELPDGRFVLATVGIERLRVVRWLPDDPHPQAEVAPFTDVAAGPDASPARARVVALLDEVASLARRLDPRVPDPPPLDDDPRRASYEAAAAAPVGPLDAQRLLEAPGAGARLALLATMLADRAADLRARLGE
jgi:Lon protease-like protein